MTADRVPPAAPLTDIEQDALSELVNLGVGRAAKSLSRMVGDQVALSVPRTDVRTREEAAAILSARERTGLVAVGQEFAGSFSGRALLIFPEANSLELVRAVVGEEVGLEDVIELEQEALAEIGNIILNGCLVVMANTLKQSLSMSLPVIMRGDSRRILIPNQAAEADELVLFLYIDFAIRSRNIHGYIALLMNMPSLLALRRLVHEFISNLGEGAAPP